MKPSPSTKALVAELLLVGGMLGYGSFSVTRLVVLLLIASQSLWLRGLDWASVGLTRTAAVRRTVLTAVAGALIILVANRLAILPIAQRLTGVPLDLSALGGPGDTSALAVWMLQAWTLAAFGEEMLFRGYLLHRIADLVGGSRVGWTAAVVLGGVGFGMAHAYQGPTGVIATSVIGCILGSVYLLGGKNLWPVVLCHAIVDTVGLLAIYFDQRWILLPPSAA